MKQWSGVVSDLISPRWLMFADGLADSVKSGVRFNNTKYREDAFDTIELPFSQNIDKDYPDCPKG